jgi:hypothetical protein
MAFTSIFACRKTTKQKGTYQVWTHENHAIQMSSNVMIADRENYIHNNPIRNGMVLKAEEYIYSSAKNYVGEEGVLKIIPVNFDWKTIR